jgi:uncharacterized protein YraI
MARLTMAMIMMMLAVAATVVPSPERARAATAMTTPYLNLRSGPSTNYSVVTVMPSGAYVEITGKIVNNFYPVLFEGASGFAAAQFLSTESGWSENNGGGSSSPAGNATVTTALNLRAGAGTNYQILSVIPGGATVQLLGEQQNGFLRVSYQGQTGWAYADFVQTGGGSSAPTTPSNPTTNGPTGSASTTAALNLRAAASLSAALLMVMPYGATVQLLGAQQNNFAQLSYAGTTGWASLDYLNIGGGGQPSTPLPTPTAPPSTEPPATTAPQGQVWATTSLNFRSGPGTNYSIVAVIPYGGSGVTDGRAQNGFWALTYNGVSGWASADYLTTTPISYSPPPPASIPGSGNAGGSGYSEQEIIQIIYDAADRYGQPREDMLRVARCESLLNPYAVNVAGSSYGLFQFIPSTWATTPYASYDLFDPWASANAAAWMWSVGRRNEWVCQ